MMETKRVAGAAAGLIPKSEFIGLEDIVHLCAGGEAPMLKSHRKAIEQFFADKALGETSRERMDQTANRCRNKVARLLGVDPADIAFLSTSSEGINLLVYGLNWQPGDNVVICDVEFPSEILPWTRLRKQGVEIRIVRNRDWYISPADLKRLIDARTRVVAISDVSYFTGQRLCLPELVQVVHNANALFCVDATHSAGVVPVEVGCADILVASCYKWLLGTHGTAIFYRNRERLADLTPPFLGWHSGITIPDWRDPTTFTLRPGADRFEMGNLGFISLYVLENALDHILKIGIPAIENHVLRLGGRVWAGLKEMGMELMTPQDETERAGNICFMIAQIDAITDWLAQQGIRVWGGYAGVGRVRVSTHLYNTESDVERLLAALKELPPALKP